MTSKPILCELYDYIEIACMFAYPITLLLESGEELKGIAKDTLVKPDKLEYLIFANDVSKEIIEIPMNSLIHMQARVTNPHFEKVSFQSE